MLFPSITEDIDDGSTIDAAYTGHGQRLKLAQDIPLTNLEIDPRTGIVTDRGFLGSLRTAGFYFAGVFEKSGGNIDFTDLDSAAELYNDQERVYLFATGKWLKISFGNLTGWVIADYVITPPEYELAALPVTY